MPVGRKSSIRRRFAANPAGGTAASAELVTDFDSVASGIVALRAGAVDYLLKPIQAGELA